MRRVRGRVSRGRLVVDEAVDLPDGSEVELVMLEDDEEWPAELDAELVARMRDVEGGTFVDASALVARLRAR